MAHACHVSLTGKVGVEFTNQLTTDNGTRYAEAARLLCIGGVLNPLWANRVCGVLGIKMTLLIGVKNPVGVDIGLDPLIHAGTVGRSR